MTKVYYFNYMISMILRLVGHESYYKPKKCKQNQEIGLLQLN